MEYFTWETLHISALSISKLNRVQALGTCAAARTPWLWSVSYKFKSGNKS